MRWYIIASANFHCFIWSSETPSQPRTYVAGNDTLDPQYFERPADLSEADRVRYFEPIALTDASGRAGRMAPALRPGRRAPARSTVAVAGPDRAREYQP